MHIMLLIEKERKNLIASTMKSPWWEAREARDFYTFPAGTWVWYKNLTCEFMEEFT